MTVYPVGYGQAYATATEIEADLIAEQYHPEFVRRFMAWLASKGGAVGPGGTRREHGAQPDKPGFAEEGKSFHQPQRYADGWYGPTAIDLVAPDGPDANHSHDGVGWALTIPQGSAEATRWGLHCNVGFPPGGEPWHIQPIEIDGFDTWVANGCPAPRANYPIPTTPGDEMDILTPRRILDTRGGPVGNPNRDTYKANANSTHQIAVAEAKGYKCAQITVTVVEPEANGHLTAWRDGSKPNTSFLNYLSGQAPGTETLFVPVDTEGRFRLWTLARTHVVIDFTGVVGR